MLRTTGNRPSLWNLERFTTMRRASTIIRELAEARRMASDSGSLVNLLRCTLLFHLGNRIPFLSTNAKRRVRVVSNGRILSVEFRQNSGDIAVLYEVLGRHIYGAPWDVLGSVKVVVDLGAHIGFATLYFASQFPMARLVSVEPVAENFELLRTNCMANGVQPTLVNGAIGARSGDTRLYLDRSSHMHSVIRGRRVRANESRLVPTLSMTDLLASSGIQEVDILKVDIEGTESELFADCGRWLPMVRAIIIEVHPGVVDYGKVISDITAHGFDYFPPGRFAPLYDVFLRTDVVQGASLTMRPGL